MKEALNTILIRALQALRVLLDVFWIGVFVVIAFGALGIAVGILCKLWIIGFNLITFVWPQ